MRNLAYSKHCELFMAVTTQLTVIQPPSEFLWPSLSDHSLSLSLFHNIMVLTSLCVFLLPYLS